MNETDFASYADDNTPYVVGNNIEDVIIKLQNASLTLFQWFYDNQMKANPDKCHFICSTDDKVNITVENQKICNSPCEKLLGVRFDSKLTFDAHINDICKKAGLKLNALARITPYMDLNKKRLLLNAFFLSQFNYCQLFWMCHNRTKNSKINRLHERFFVSYIITKNPLSSNYWKLIILSSFTIEILEPLPLKCIKYIIAFHQLS